MLGLTVDRFVLVDFDGHRSSTISMMQQVPMTGLGWDELVLMLEGRRAQLLVHGPTFALDESPIQNHFGTFVQCFCPAVVHGASHEAVDQHVGLFGVGPESIFQEVGLSHPFASSGHGTHDYPRMH